MLKNFKEIRLLEYKKIKIYNQSQVKNINDFLII